MSIHKTFGLLVLIKSSIIILILISIFSCQKENSSSPLRYYEAGLNGVAADWRDSSFIIATNSILLIAAIEEQLALPVSQRNIVNGKLVSGNGGYNINAAHAFKWRFKEDDWQLTDLSIEIYDGRPYCDLDNDLQYWLHNMKRFAPWDSYIKREIAMPG